MDRIVSRLPLLVAAAALALSACSTTPEPQARPEPAPEPEPVVEVYQGEPEPAPPPAQAFREVHPQQYVVKKGDTLWDIATRFLRDPWVWPEIWYNNRQVANPHLIFPGDVLTIIYVDGRPRITVTGRDDVVVSQPGYTAGGRPVVKLSPAIRAEDLDQAIPSIPIEAIQQLLVQVRVVDRESLENAPYIVASVDDRLINATGDRVYVRGLADTGQGRYSVYRPQKPLRDTVTDEILGYEAVYVGDGTLVEAGDPATVLLNRTVREALRDDRLAPHDAGEIDRDFFPRPPAEPLQGRVISLFDAISQIGTYEVAVVNLGASDGVEVGHLLAIDRAGGTTYDEKAPRGEQRVELPPVRAGLMMVIKSFDRVSYGLVMQATRAIRIDDLVRTP